MTPNDHHKPTLADALVALAEAPLTDILDEVARPHEGRGKVILFDAADTVGPPPVFPRSVIRTPSSSTSTQPPLSGVSSLP